MKLLERIFETRETEKNGFVLALGGGGGRGLAHLGVLAVLEEHHLRPDAIVGTSIGAMFGAMYAVQPDARVVTAQAMEILTSKLFNSISVPSLEDVDSHGVHSWLSRIATLARQTMLFTRVASDRSIADTDVLLHIASTFSGGESFADAQIPVYVTAVEFPSGECHLFSEHSGISLPSALSASMAIPGVFEPVQINGKQYVDGGVASDLPAREARMVAGSDQLVVAVNVGARPRADMEPGNVYGMIDWSAEIKSLHLRRYSKLYADVLIEPLVSFIQWNDFSEPEREIEKGRMAALEMMPALNEKLGH